MASLAERTASPWTATRCEIDRRGARPAPAACAALCVAMDGRRQLIGWRRGFGAAPAMMVPRRRGATNTTLAATPRHPCRSGMVTADCARSRSRPETVVASGGTEGSAENSPRSPLLLSTRVREALMMAGAGGAVRATGWRATAMGGKQGDWQPNRLTGLLHKEFDSNERLRVSNWIVHRLYYYAVK